MRLAYHSWLGVVGNCTLWNGEGSLFQESCSVLELRSLLQGWDRDLTRSNTSGYGHKAAKWMWSHFPPDPLQLLGLSVPCSAFQQCQPIKSQLRSC